MHSVGMLNELGCFPQTMSGGEGVVIARFYLADTFHEPKNPKKSFEKLFVLMDADLADRFSTPTVKVINDDAFQVLPILIVGGQTNAYLKVCFYVEGSEAFLVES